MGQIEAGQIRNGMKLEIDSNPYVVVQADLVKPGKGQAFTRTRIKNLKTKKVIELTFKSHEKVEEADVEEKKMRFLYKDGDDAVFMDDNTYDQISIGPDILQENSYWLKEELIYSIVFYKAEVIEIVPPTFMELKIIESAPGLRGDTTGRVMKPAKLETGAEVQVPIFINEGETIKVDTRTSEYVSRV